MFRTAEAIGGSASGTRIPAPIAEAESGDVRRAAGQRIEFVHTRDAGLAVANAVGSGTVWGRILLIGGGSQCQFIYGDMVARLLEAMGVGMLPEEAFTLMPFCTDWLDTRESQRLLRYQRYGLDEYIREMQSLWGVRRHLIRAFRPLLRRWLLKHSSYYRERKGLTWDRSKHPSTAG